MPLFLPPLEDRFIVNETPSGIKDGVNKLFTTSNKFVKESIKVYHNGRRLERADDDDPRNGDFFVKESAGASTGFDTIELIRFAPSSPSRIIVDYTEEE